MDFGDLDKMQEMMRQARDAQHTMEQKLSETVVEAESGGGLVHVRMNGRKELLRLKIDPSTLGSQGGDIELLEDLITAAVNEASRRADDVMASSVQGMLGGLGLPGLR